MKEEWGSGLVGERGSEMEILGGAHKDWGSEIQQVLRVVTVQLYHKTPGGYPGWIACCLHWSIGHHHVYLS